MGPIVSTRYRKGERFRVRSTGYAPPLDVDASTLEENRAAVAGVLERERPRGLRQFRYEGRYILADGRPRSFRVDAHNLSDAAAAIERQAREELGAAFASSRCYGTERV